MATLRLLAVELLFLAVTHWFGGPPWTVIGVIAILAQVPWGVCIDTLAIALPSLVWLAFFHATGNRELFFPYTMYLAACAALRAPRLAGTLGGVAVVAVFMAIRVWQHATAKVLGVEFVIAAAILAVVVLAGSRFGSLFGSGERGRIIRNAATAMTASLLAYASLAF